MQIWKFHCMFIWKQYPEHFAFLIFKNVELFIELFKVFIFPKK